MYDLQGISGAIIFGGDDGSSVALAAGETLLSDPIPVSSGVPSVSFDIRATPDGTATLAVKVRAANGYLDALPLSGEQRQLIDLGITSPATLASFSAAARAILTAPGDTRWVQLEIACSGADVELVVIGTAGGGSSGQMTVSGGVSLSGALPAGTNNIGDMDVASLPGTAQADIAATNASNTLIKTATEALQTSNAGTGLKTQLTAAGGLTDLAAVNVSNAAIKVATEALAAIISAGKLATAATLQAGTAAFGKLAANAGVIIGAVEIAASQTVGLAAGAAAVGTVGVTSVTLASSVYDVDEKTDLSTSAFQLASHVNTYGTRISNTSSNGNVVTVGGTTVTGARFIARIYAGQDCWFEVTNSNLLYVYGSASSTRFTYGGY